MGVPLVDQVIPTDDPVGARVRRVVTVPPGEQTQEIEGSDGEKEWHDAKQLDVATDALLPLLEVSICDAVISRLCAGAKHHQ